MDWRGRFIQQAKLAVNEFIKVLKADIAFDEIEDETKGKTALSTKKDAFIEAKTIIANLLEIDYGEQEWARNAVTELIEAGEESVNNLIESLSNEIFIEDGVISDDVNDLKNAIKSRGIAFKDSLDLIDALTDLKRIASQEEIVLKENDYSAGYPEMYANKYIEMGDKSGYSEKHDAVIIDPDGSIGEKINIMGVDIILPEQPPEETMLNYGKRKNEQYFTRQKPPHGTKKEISQIP